jgi:hypothetical protein
LLADSFGIHAGTKGTQISSETIATFHVLSDVPLSVSVQWYIGLFECNTFGDPRNMPNVPLVPQFGNVPVMYYIILYRNMYLYRNRPGLVPMAGKLLDQRGCLGQADPPSAVHDT